MTDQDQKNSNEVEEEVQTEDSQEEVNSELNNLTYEELLED